VILEYNKTHNITGAKTRQAVFDNIEDSIYPLNFLHVEDIKQAIDIGSGAGFPGLLLALAMPNTHFTLFEPIKKKSAFLHLAKAILKIDNVSIVSQRVEAAKAFKADLISSRAVTDTDLLINLCKNFIAKKTFLLFYKGENVTREITHLKEYNIYNKGKRNYLLIKDIDVD
jgi:16S rRNA (guanine527-N7)-methyltransferase